LMKGGGLGQSVRNSFLDQLPVPAGQVELTIVCSLHADRDEFPNQVVSSPPPGSVYLCPDSREGWVECLRQIMDLAQVGGGQLTIDLSDIRCRGSLIKGFGGTASGPAPLITLLHSVTEILNGCVGKQLNSLDVMSINHAIASCVISGNVRRSARISTKHWDDHDIFDFIAAKLDDPTAHFTTNISVEIDQRFIDQLNLAAPHATSVYQAVIAGMIENGEPGFFNSELSSVGENGDVSSSNPCGEIALEEWEPCNLGHLNLANFGQDVGEACDAARLLIRFLIRATFAPVEDPNQRKVLDRNRRTGLGLYGVQEWAASHSVRFSEIPESDKLRHYLEDLVAVIEDEAADYCSQLRIPKPIKSRTIAPTGTVAKLSGHSEGIHPIYARHFLQRIRFADNDKGLQEHIDKGRHIEDCLYSPNTKVVTIPTRNAILDHYPPELIESVDEIEIDSMFEVQAWFQKHWADNAVSFTANIDPDTKPADLAVALKRWLPHLKGTTVFPDLSRPQSPYERLSDGVFELLETVTGFENESGQAIDECASGACPVR
jgi:ribonucleoside-triphosphate reductase